MGNEIPNIPNLIRIFDNAIINTYPSYVCTLSVRSTDPESDNIYYEIQWDLDPNFMSASSDTIGPYISGDNVITTIPVATETLYYWRARATDDPLLISNWSCWSEVRSFIMYMEVSDVYWYQVAGDPPFFPILPIFNINLRMKQMLTYRFLTLWEEQFQLL